MGPNGFNRNVRSSTRNAVVLTMLAIGTIGLVGGLLAPLWAFNSWFPGDPSSSRTLLFSIGPPGAYFQSPILGVGSPPPPQSALDLDIVLWADLAFGVVAGVVAILRGALAYRRESAPALTQGATVASLGLAAVAMLLLVVQGPSAYAPGTSCSTCTAYSGQTASIAWSWTLQGGSIAILVATVALVAALLLESKGMPDPNQWQGRLGAAGIVAGFALFSVVFGSNWQTWYPTGSAYLLLWGLIVAIPIVSAGLAIRAVRRTKRRAPSPPSK